MIDHFLMFVFLHIAKTGGTSIGKSLGRTSKTKLGHHKALRIDAAMWEEYYTFCFVRNPWDLVASAYKYHTSARYREGGKFNFSDISNFEEYVTRATTTGLLVPFQRYINHAETDTPIDFIGRFENIEEDSRVVYDHLGIDAKLGHRNKSPNSNKGHYSTIHTPYTIKRIEEFYRKDIEQFEYEFKNE